MFFFIGGVQPKTIELDTRSVFCPSCGLRRARIKRTDHYLSIFFLPVLRIKKGTPFMICDKCGAASSEHLNAPLHRSNNVDSKVRCPHCGGRIEGGFKFCPFCGKGL